MNPYMTYLSEVKKAYIRAGVSLPYVISDRSASSDEVALNLSQAQAVLEGFGFLQDVLSVCNSAYCTHIDGISGEMLYKDRLRELFLPEFKERVAAEQMAQLEDLPKPLESISQGSQIPILGVFGKLDPDAFLIDSESKSTQTPEQRTQIIDYFSSVLSSTSDDAENSEGVAISSEEEVLSSDLDDIDDELEDFEELEMQELADLEDDVWNEDDTLAEPLDSVENLSVDETVSDVIDDDFFDNAEPASYEARFTTGSANDSFDDVDDEDTDEEEFNSFDDVDDEDTDEEEFNSFDEVVDDDDTDEEEFNSFDEVDDEDTGENNWNLFAEDDEGMSVENITDEEDEFVFSSDDEDDETMELFTNFDSVTDEDTFDDVIDDSEDDFDSVEDDSEDDFDSVEDDSEDDFDSVEDSDTFDDVVDDSEEGDFDEFDNVVEDEISSDDSDSEFSLFDNLEDEGEDWGEVDVSAEDTSVDDAEFEEDDDSWGEELDNAISEALGSLMPDEEDDYFVFSEDDEDDEISSTEPDLNVTNQIPAELGNTKQDFDEVLADALERGVSNLFAWGKRKLRGSRDDDTSH